MNKADALAFFNFMPGTTPDADSVRAAFGVAVRHHHPDTGEGGADMVGRAKKARDVLLTAAGEVRPATCPHCRGSGWVQVGFKQERCVRGC